MWEAVQEGIDMSACYEQDDRDKEFQKKFKGFVNIRSHKMTSMGHEISEKAQAALAEGEDLEGSDKAAQARTSSDYWNGLKSLVGFLQAETNSNYPGVLKDGKLHIWQFLSFNTPDFMEYNNPIATIEKHEKSMGNRGHQLAAFMSLGKIMLEELEKMEVRQSFANPEIVDPRERMVQADKDADQAQAR